MSSRGVTTLAEIARTLNTTPQAVSNWKSRNQVPYRIAVKLSQLPPAGNPQTSDDPPIYSSPIAHYSSPIIYEKDTISLSDILLTIAEQLKVIVLTTFISVFLTFTYVQFIKQPLYVSWATVLLPESKMSNLGGLAGLASQFGVNVPMEATADLSSPSLYPELLRSRTFAEKILDKEFYLDEYGKKLTLLAILTQGDKPPKFERDSLITEAVKLLNEKYLAFDQDPQSTFSIIKVTAPEPRFAKNLADVVLAELESLNRYFKSETVNEKTAFIENRISSVEVELETSEVALKVFNEKNRQISSPALALEQERLERDAEVQRGVYLTLKQQLELAKIEEVQKSSIVQVLDMPQIALGPSNKNLLLSVVLSLILGVGLGFLFGFFRSYLDNNDMEERKKLRRIKHFMKKKTKDLVLDRRISGTISVFMLIGLPFYLRHESNSPVFFGQYSLLLLMIILVYIATMMVAIGLYLSSFKKK